MDSGESSDNETVKFFSASKVKKRIVKVPQNHSSSSLHWVGDPDYSWTLVNALIWDWVVFNKNLKFLRGQACRLRCSSVGCGLTPVVAATAVSGVVESQSPGRAEVDRTPVHYVHFVKYDVTVSFYDAVSDTIK